MDKNVLYKIPYGLYILTANNESKDNGCIINTLTQVGSTPSCVSVSVNKANYTTDMIQKSKQFNVSILTESVKFETFKQFGFQSGKNVDKFADFKDVQRSKNGILYLTKDTNSYLSVDVTNELDLGSHILFIGEVKEAETISEEASVTYSYYHKNIKPTPQQEKTKKGWRCKICNYVYEGEELPPDFICPICKHGIEDFERIG